MKILFLAHRTPYPPDKADKIRSYNLLSQLARKHTLSLAYWIDDARDIKHTNVLRRLCQGRITSLVLDPTPARARGIWSLCNGKSFSEGYYYSAKFQTAVNSIMQREQPDLIYVFSSPMAAYVEGFHNIPRIVDFVNVSSHKLEQLAGFAKVPIFHVNDFEDRRFSRFQLRVSSWAYSSLFVSTVEADQFRQLGGEGHIVDLPNGVKGGVRRLPVREESIGPPRNDRWTSSKPVKLLFVGTMSDYLNVDAVLYFAREIFPLIRNRYPQAVFEIIGSMPPRSVRRLNGRNGIRVLGEVSDVKSFLIRADVSVAPLRVAGGVQNEILDAMAMGVPVVATPEATNGLDVRDGEEILTGNAPEKFAVQVMRLLSEPQLRNYITKRAWSLVNQAYNWDVIGVKLEGLIMGLQKRSSNEGWLTEVPAGRGP